MKKKFLSILIASTLALSLVACGGKDNTNDANPTATEGAKDTTTDTGSEVPDKVVATGTYDTLVIGTQSFNGVFSPMFSSNAYDVQAYSAIFDNVSKLNESGELIDDAGHVEAEEITAADGHTQIKYTVSIQEGILFSDGEPVTIDDMIFLYHVLADPTYDGSSTFSTLDIVGMKEYYYDTPDYTDQLNAITTEVESKYALGVISDEDYLAYLIDTNLEGWWAGIDSYDWVAYIAAEGFDTADIDVTNEEQLLKRVAEVELANYRDAYDPQSYYQSKGEENFITGNLEDGVDVASISGIEKIDDYTCTVLFDSVNIYGDREVAYSNIVPEHYYGVGYSKGNLTSIKEKNGAPLGSGPYKFVSYQDNVVTLEANTLYYGEIAKIPTIKFQVVSENDKVDAVIMGQMDITDPSASLEVIDQLESEGMAYSLVDNPGYGFIALSAERLPDINVRKGLMHLMNRAPAVESYYGDLAEVIERPMTPTVAEYPTDATEMYGYDTAKALEYFTAAGYAKDASGKLVKDGEQLVIVAAIGGNGEMNHPSAPILTQMANDMAAMGAELVIHDLDFSTLTNKRDAGELDMWVMAWGNSTSCDLTQIFGSQGNDNDTKYYSDEIDELQKEILKTIDFEERKALVAKELDLIMEGAVYMPVYQRKNMEIYNADTIVLDTLPELTTTYWNYADEINKLQLQ